MAWSDALDVVTDVLDLGNSVDQYRFIGFEMRRADTGNPNIMQWDDFQIQITNSDDTGNPELFDISAGVLISIGGQTSYLYYVRGENVLRTSLNFNDAIGPDSSILAIYRGGDDIELTNETGTIRDGSLLIENSIGVRH